MTSTPTISQLKTKFFSDLEAVKTEQDLQELRDAYLGRKRGALAALLKSISSAPIEKRPSLGKQANELKGEIDTALLDRKKNIGKQTDPVDRVDITLTSRQVELGRRHPLTILREQLESIFTGLGFEILHGPEVEDDYHNFEALNMPSEHPARDMQDTLYLETPLRSAQDNDRPPTLLRTHTSGMQIRYMEDHEPPVRIIAPGLVYRRDNPDLTHSPMFQQIEGLVVGENVSMSDLKGYLNVF